MVKFYIALRGEKISQNYFQKWLSDLEINNESLANEG